MEPLPDPQLDDPLVQFQHDPAWRMVYVSLTVVQVGMAIFFVAGLIAWIIFLVLALELGFWGVFSAEGMMAMALPLAVALGSLFTSFVGVCLCWNPPPVDSLRIWSRACIIAVLITILSGAVAFGFREFGEGEGGLAWFYVLLIAILVGSTSFMSWDSFLRGIGFFFQKEPPFNKLTDVGVGINLIAVWGLLSHDYLNDWVAFFGVFAVYCYFFLRYFLPLRRARLTIVECTRGAIDRQNVNAHSL
jgi:hypothetical protein